MLLENKISVITGAGQGIGKAIAVEFAREGSKVVINDLMFEKAEEVHTEIAKIGGESLVVRADVSQTDEISSLVEKVINVYGDIDILVNNAGIITPNQPFIKSREQEWALLWNINLKGVLVCCHAVIPHMMRKQYGKIINISSGAGKIGTSGLTVYSAVKAGVIGFGKALARELASHQITVNSIAPGPILTPLLGGLSPEFMKGIKETVPLMKIGSPNDIAYMAKFLASSQADFITGQCFSVDGGRVMC